MNSAEEWVTVAEAARRLGVAARTARRYADRMPGHAVRWTDRRTGRLVLLTVMQTVKEASERGNAVTEDGQADSKADSGQDMRPQAAAALSAHLQEEIAYLRQELTALRETHGQEIQRRDQAEAEMRRLLLADREEIRRLRQQLALTAAPSEALVKEPASDAAPGAQNEVQGRVGDEKSGPAGNAARVENQPKKGADRARWWEFWKR